ncbi:hypothetical protein [Epilithonimonas sp.]|uniref:hypothetical protein n=1 Tax=Epilithonimonas sp. TaxID=2894511 RepID=UPI00289DABD9|nr:hypothetical protein [Epilithonimonas sp.]
MAKRFFIANGLLKVMTYFITNELSANFFFGVDETKQYWIRLILFLQFLAARLERLSFLREAMPSKKIIAEDG